MTVNLENGSKSPAQYCLDQALASFSLLPSDPNMDSPTVDISRISYISSGQTKLSFISKILATLTETEQQRLVIIRYRDATSENFKLCGLLEADRETRDAFVMSMNILCHHAR